MTNTQDLKKNIQKTKNHGQPIFRRTRRNKRRRSFQD